MPKEQSTITHSAGVMMFSGEKAVDAFRIATLISAIGLLKAGIIPTRGMTMTKALKIATEYTGIKYKRTEADKAAANLKHILDIRKSECTIKGRS